MGKQITLQNLQTSLDRTKSYVDSRANANVIRTETTLWEGAGRNGQTINLSSSVRDFDEIIIYAVKDSGNLYRQWQALTVKTSDIVIGKGVIFYAASGDSSKDWIRPIFQTDTSVKIEAYVYPSTQPDVYNTITRIVGIKYSHPVEYTTTEKVIGTHLGKTLYEKTLTNINVPAATTSVPTQVVALNAYGIEDTWTVVKAEGIVRLANNADIMVPFCNPLNTIPDAVWVSRQSSTGRWVLASCCQQTGVAKALTLKYIKESL